MKFQPDTQAGVNVIARHEPGTLWVAHGASGNAYTHSLIVPWVGEVQPWGAADFQALTAEHFERIAALQPEVVIFGSGRRLRFAPPALLQVLIERRIGVECMDTAAACRTYNVLVSEHRCAVAALLVETG
jgi:uncharacterized protein